jgi:hypothetical protein
MHKSRIIALRNVMKKFDDDAKTTILATVSSIKDEMDWCVMSGRESSQVMRN